VYYKEGKQIDEKKIKEVWSTFIDLPESYEEKSKTRANGERLCMDYVATYSSRDKEWEVLGTEQKLIIPIGDVSYAVKCDLVIKVNGNIFAVEHKTTSRITPTFFARFTPNTQVSAQTEAVRQEYGECSGVIVNALESGWVTKPVLIDPNDSDSNNYSIREVKHSKYYGKEMAYCSGFHSNFQREIVNRTKEQLLDFKENAKNGAIKLITDTQLNNFVKHEQRCHDYKAGCPYKEICISVADENIISNLYEKCDPYQYLKEEV
jgi:hypothetical protein